MIPNKSPNKDQIHVNPEYVTVSDVDEENDITTNTEAVENKQLLKAKKKIQKKTLDNVIALTFLALANFLYILSDRKCPYEDPSTCAKNFIFPNLVRWAIQVFVASLLFVVIIYHSFKRKISIFYALGAFANVIYLGFFYDPILNAREYGQMFGFFLILTFVICMFLLGLVSLVIYCRRKCWPLLIISPLLLIIFCLCFYFVEVKHSCNHWSDGLGDDMIQNQQGVCQVEKPKICAYEITSGWFDLSRWKKCSNFKADEYTLKQYYPNSPIIGFPRTEIFKEEQRLPIQPGVLDNIVGLKSQTDPAGKDLEIFLDKSSQNPQILIDVKRNQTLIDERSKIQKEGLAKNVLVVYIDSLSRVNALRKLKKTMSWFESYMNDRNPDAEGYQFFRYHSIAPYTHPNLYEALYGKHPNDKDLTNKNRLPSYLQTYKENGYITGHATDYCQTTPLDINRNGPLKDTPYDHEAISFACDPHYHDPKSPYGIFTGPYSSMRRCLYGKDVFEYVYEYGNQFWRKYKDQKKILYLDFLNAHEGTGEVVKYMDDALYQFLDGLKNEKLLEDTAVIFYADHGLHMQGLFYVMGISQVFTEISLPALYTVFPKRVTEKFGENIVANEQKLVSAHEVHHLLKSLAEGENSESVKSSLLNEMPSMRTCDDIGVINTKCVCQ